MGDGIAGARVKGWGVDDYLSTEAEGEVRPWPTALSISVVKGAG